jgi:hypothetical protein
MASEFEIHFSLGHTYQWGVESAITKAAVGIIYMNGGLISGCNVHSSVALKGICIYTRGAPRLVSIKLTLPQPCRWHSAC